jgi:hypothetical protein
MIGLGAFDSVQVGMTKVLCSFHHVLPFAGITPMPCQTMIK